MVVLKSIARSISVVLFGLVALPIFIITILVLGGRWGYEDEIE